MRWRVLVLGLAIAGCSGSAGGAAKSDAANIGDAFVNETNDGRDSAVDIAADALDAGMDSVPEACRGLGSVRLSAPTVRSGMTSPGQSAVIGLTMTDMDPNGFVSYVGAVIASSTSGVSIMYPEVAPAGASIDGKASKTVEFTANFDSSVSPGTQASFSARVFGWGHPAPDCANAFVLAFSLLVE